jgi:hypothetical protein
LPELLAFQRKKLGTERWHIECFQLRKTRGALRRF